jgi:hypothetical protein
MKRVIKLGLGLVLLIVPFIATSSFADELRISGKWAGSVVQVAFDLNGDGVSSNLIDAQIKGSFGMKSLDVLSEYMPVGLCGTDPDLIQISFLYSKPILSFANGDQLWGTMGSGSMCMHLQTAEFTGEGHGVFTGGTGRFEGASGPFTVTFSGKNLTLMTMGFGFAPIRGDIVGTVVLP